MSNNPSKMNKTFKWIYYPVLAILCIIMLAFGLNDTVNGMTGSTRSDDYYKSVRTHISQIAGSSHSSLSNTSLESTRNYIIKELTDNGFDRVDEVKENEESTDEDAEVTTVTDWARSSGNVPHATVTVQSALVTQNIQNEIEGRTDNYYIAGRTVNNIVVAIPGSDTLAGNNARAVVITARYDTRDDTTGATDNSAFVASLLQSAIEYNQEGTHRNDLVIVFTEDDDLSYGAYCFTYAFKGLDNVVSRMSAGLSLDAFGNDGTLAVTASNTNDYKMILNYVKSSKTALNSSLTEIILADEISENAAMGAFNDVPSIQVAVLGNLTALHSQEDTVANLSTAVLNQQGDFIKSYLDTFSNATKTYTSSSDAVYFSYLDLGTVVYSTTAAYVLGGLALALVIAAIVFNVLKKGNKSFAIGKVGMGIVVSLLSILCAVVALYGMYFACTLILSGFGVLPIQSVINLRLYNSGLMIGWILIAFAAQFGFTSLFKRVFKVKGADVTRGNAILITIVGAILSFVIPKASYYIAIPALFSALVFLLLTIFKTPFKNRFGFDIERLFLYAVPAIFCLPFVLGAIGLFGMAFPMYLMPAIMSVFMLLLGSIIAYVDYSRPVFDAVAKKLPPRTVPVKETVTEMVEDNIKKGRFTEQTFVKKYNEKVAWNYKNYFGISVVSIIAAILILVFGSFNTSFTSSNNRIFKYNDAIYNDALIYSYDFDSSSATRRLEVYDLMAYKYIRYAVNDLKWDNDKKCYYKSVPSNDTIVTSATQPQITKSGDIYTVTPYDRDRSYVELSFPQANSITSIKITSSSDVEYVYEFLNQDSINLIMPYGFGVFTMEVKGTSSNTIDYIEKRPSEGNDNNPLAELSEWAELRTRFIKTNIMDYIRSGVVLTSTFSL